MQPPLNLMGILLFRVIKVKNISFTGEMEAEIS
jgi:hypothetical protein